MQLLMEEVQHNNSQQQPTPTYLLGEGLALDLPRLATQPRLAAQLPRIKKPLTWTTHSYELRN